MSLNVISYNGTNYGDDAIEQATGYGEASYVGDTLPYSTLEADIWDFGRALLQFCTNDDVKLYQTADDLFMVTYLRTQDLTAYTYAAPVTWTHRGSLLMQRFLTACKRIGKYKFRLSCVSGVGLIAESRHYGGLYNGTLFGDMLEDIVGGAFAYQIDEEISAIPMYGWLPVDTRRANLQRMLTASGAVIRTNAQGLPWFTSPSTINPTAISDSGIEMGGTVDYPTPFQAVKITEHAFAALSTDILKTLFDGESAAEPLISPLGVSMEGTLVTFADPMHDLQITNGTILESGVNYAVLGPSSACTLTGLVYSHTERIVTAGTVTADEQATKRLEDSTLVNLFNSENVAQRWYQFYSSRRKVQITAVWGGEQPNDAVSFSDPYDDPLVGLITALDVRLSAKLTADMTIQAGNLPDIVGNYYQHIAVISTSQTWTVPSESNGKIRAVLIGGGDGGGIGNDGEAGNGSSSGGNGGEPGTPGAGGKILIITLSVSAGDQFQVTIGQGGAGETSSTAAGSGTATMFGTYTSDNGFSTDGGYIETFSGALYGAPGESGIPGNAGAGPDSSGESLEYNGVVYSVGERGNDNTSAGATGGYGGGPAAGSNGGNGGNGVSGSNYTAGGEGGDGGSATIAPPAATIYGTGGTSGHGGGGGGATGTPYLPIVAGPGAGGSGGPGGAGAPGVLLIYY